jgi:hypothetical protein
VKNRGAADAALQYGKYTILFNRVAKTFLYLPQKIFAMPATLNRSVNAYT